jgi:ABC-type nitrate/sulfonate/bicarbonate transport system substrate-binding protein
MPGHGASAFAYLLSLALLALIRPADAADPTVIGVNAFPNAKALPLHAGIAKGIFEKRGLKLSLELARPPSARVLQPANSRSRIQRSTTRSTTSRSSSSTT